jgi:hypothetical protein
MRSCAFGAVLFLLVGCTTPKEGDREVNHQNIGAGKFIKLAAAEPEVRQAGADVEENSKTLEKNLIGPPAKPLPYSPANSERGRKQSDDDHATPWWQTLLGGLGSFLLGNVFTRLFATVAPRIIGGPAASAALAVIEGIARAREKARSNPDGKLSEADLLEALAAAQGDPKIHEFVRSLSHKAEARLAGRL